MVDLVNKPEEGNPSEIEQPEASIPEQFRGKSTDDIIGMYQHLEKKLGQQSEELGSLRALAEQAVSAPAKEGSSTDDVDFFDNPEKAIERIVEQKLAPFNASLREQQQTAVRERLDQHYPGWETTAKSPEFETWVAGSKERTRLFVRANGADWDAANELFETWGKINASDSSSKKAATKAVERDRALRAAKTEKGSAGVDPRKILSRSDLRTLRQTNPSRYNELLPDIRKAYAEGRVR